MASEATTHRARPPPPSGCASPVRRAAGADSDSAQLLQRPFTASGARATRLVGVLVRWGEHLDRLVEAADAADDEAAERSPPSTYVALRTSRQLEGEPAVDRPEKRGNSDDPDDHASYELRSSPFATTRVVERSARPMWNEQLLVALPAEWRQQRQHAWTVHVDVVRRDPSQQEDTLLATVALPLTTLLRRGPHERRAPRHVAIDLVSQQPASTQPAPRVYLSLTDSDDLEDASDVVEVVVEELGGDSATTSGPAEIEGPAVVVLSSAAAPASSPRNRVRDLFESVSGAHPSPNGSSSCSTWITPTARLKRVDNSSSLQRLRWQFPALFSICRDGGANSTDTAAASSRLGQLHASLYSVVPSGDSAYDFQLVGAASLDLLTVPTDGTATRMKTALSPHQALEVTVRRWVAPSWMRFQRESVSRRVITTNHRHRKRAALQALEWTGALCRGLNRYPISSFCDDGGLSGLLARYLATASVHDNDGHHANAERGSPAGDAGDDAHRRPEELLNQHIRLLQHEVMAKQETIQTLQREAEASMTALRKCGAELVAARKEVRARDGTVAQLQTKLRELEQREADQTQELLAATSGLTGLRLDGHGAQRLNMLIFKYKELEQRHASCEAELTDTKRAVATMEQLEKRYSELEQAHVVQAGLVQRLQQDKARHGDLQRTIRMQEKVIQKLERAVTQQPQPVPPQLPTLPPTSGAHQSTPFEEDTPLLAMRVQVLEQQLQTNAKAAASEIGRLKMRVMELETQLSGNSQSGEYESHARRPER